MNEKDARCKFRQIVSAVQYCHQKMIVHRDLKVSCCSIILLFILFKTTSLLLFLFLNFDSVRCLGRTFYTFRIRSSLSIFLVSNYSFFHLLSISFIFVSKYALIIICMISVRTVLGKYNTFFYLTPQYTNEIFFIIYDD